MFEVQIFDSRNTCVIDTAMTLQEAHEMGRGSSYGKYIISDNNGFEEFEKKEGQENYELVSWTYPNGLGQIKINS